MSFSFSVEAPEPPAIEALFAGIDDVRCCENLPKEGPLPEGYFHVYRWGTSTRGVELHHESGSLRVRILTCSPAAEVAFAVELTKNAAAATGRPVSAENGEACSVETLGADFGTEWAASTAEGSARALVQIARSQKDVLKLMGPIRTFHFGPRTLAEVERGGPDSGLADRLYEAMRRVQYVDTALYFEAGVLSVTTPRGEVRRVSTWAPGIAYLFSDVEFLHLLVGPPHDVLVRKSALSEIAGDRCVYLDEVHTLVRPVPPDDWPAFVEDARRHEVSLPDG